MAGHSHAANIKHKKDAMDKKRSKVFSKIARKLIVEARLGGPDPVTNASLRLIVDMARAANMPKDVIQRNIDKGAGVGSDAANFEELAYEGYGPGGIAVMVECLTDNRHRTAPEIKKIFDRAGGNLGEPGCVGYMFDLKSVFLVDPKGKTEDEVMEIVMEAEADDMEEAEGQFLITAAPQKYSELKEILENAGFGLEVAEMRRMASTEIEVAELDLAEKLKKLVDNLEDNDDVQNVYTNHILTDEVQTQLDAKS
ncbi:MAG: YebC/PmpR family DNA-binding transcriptional regulator [Planctomycetes bacterium]|nr:YebC/PmpR family DNA-binding transcriptional regulator [Planctomycetota bacterium]